ncbi:glycosyltransferase [Candidatus Woesearchaeota archaeon]|nr:glycosyltransferase [Candidatus Woesearchaeota archaeon]
MSQITAVIVSKNREKQVKKLVKNLRSQDLKNIEIIIIDDFSDKPYKILGVKLIRNQKPMRAPASRNIGIRAVKGKYILMLDDDLEIKSKNFISKSIELLQSNPKIGAVIPTKIDDYGKSQIEYSVCRETFFSKNIVHTEAKRGFVDFGAMVYVSYTTLLQELQYDPMFGIYKGHSFREESDIQLRIRKKGYRLFFEPTIKVVHKISPQGGQKQNMSDKIYWFAFNHIIYLRKHHRLWPMNMVAYSIVMLGYCIKYGITYLPSALLGLAHGAMEKFK